MLWPASYHPPVRLRACVLAARAGTLECCIDVKQICYMREHVRLLVVVDVVVVSVRVKMQRAKVIG